MSGIETSATGGQMSGHPIRTPPPRHPAEMSSTPSEGATGHDTAHKGTSKNQLRLVFWETTSGCNLECVHCRRIDVAAELARQDMTTEYKNVCEGCRARAFGETGNYLAEEPYCNYVPRTMQAASELPVLH